jgi:uncharacterized protein
MYVTKGSVDMVKPFEKAQEGLKIIQDAICDLLTDNPVGLRNFEVTKSLGLHSDQNGRNKDYLAWSILGTLMKEGKVTKRDSRYLVSQTPEWP